MRQMFYEFTMTDKTGKIIKKEIAVLATRAVTEVSTNMIAYYKLGYKNISYKFVRKDY